MTTRHQVTHANQDGPDPDYRIDALGGPDANGWQMTMDNIVRGLRSGSFTLYTVVNNRQAEVRAYQTPKGLWYAKTDADGFGPNNLLKLPRIPLSYRKVA